MNTLRPDLVEFAIAIEIFTGMQKKPWCSRKDDPAHTCVSCGWDYAFHQSFGVYASYLGKYPSFCRQLFTLFFL